MKTHPASQTSLPWPDRSKLLPRGQSLTQRVLRSSLFAGLTLFAGAVLHAAPEIALIGNGVEIASGDVTPSSVDGSDFGSVNEVTGSFVRTFIIRNTGTDPLTLSGTPLVSLSGSPDFTVTQLPTSPVAATSGTTTFQITFNPTGYGVKTATVTLANDDSDEGSYTFAIQGTGAAVATGDLWRPRLIDGQRGWTAVTSSADGSKLVGVVTGNKVYTSADYGSTWTTRDSNRSWKAVTSSSDGTKLAAVVQGGQIYTSGDSGVTWTARDSIRQWSGVASSADGTRLYACENGGFIYTSADSGATWTSLNAAGSRSWYSVACSSDGSKLVSAAYTNFLYTSGDFGGSWNARAISGKWWAVASSSDGNKLVAALYGGRLYVSGDSGLTWTPQETARSWNAVASSTDGNTLLASVAGGKLYVSKDAGLNWSAHEADRAWRGVAMNASGDRMLAGSLSSYLFTSNDIVLPAEITLTGNSVEIVSGDAAPDTADSTDFGGINYANGNSIQRTFTLANSGQGALLLTGTAPNWVNRISGSSDFTVTTQPGFSVATNSSTTFTITFDPSSIGVKTATFSIANEDIDEDFYTFTVSGEGHFRPSPTCTVSTSVGSRKAVGNGAVNPNGLESSYQFEYATNAGFGGSMFSAAQTVPAGFTPVVILGDLIDLKANTQYYVRLVATNSLGSTPSSSMTFTTDYLGVTRQAYGAAQGVTGGGELLSIRAGVINNDGRVLMQGTGLAGSGSVTGADDSWLMTDTAGNTKVIAREGASVAGGGTLTAAFPHFLLTNSGVSFALDKIAGAPTTSDYAYFTSPEDSSSFDIASREGDSAPDGGTFIQHVGKPALDGQDRIYFTGNLSGVALNINSGVWYDSGSSINRLIQAGTDLSAVTTDPAWLGGVSNILAAGGDGCAFVAGLQNNPADGTLTDPAKNLAIISLAPAGTPVIVARKGDVVPTTTTTISNFSGVSRNSLADHAYTAIVTGTGVTTANDEVLVATLGTQPVFVAREGVTAIGGAPIKSFGSYYITSKRQVFFLANLAGVAADVDRVLCRWTQANGIVVMAREGSAAVGAGAATYGSLHSLSVSDGGAVALLSIMSDGTWGLMRMKASDNQLSQLARSGAGRTISYGGTAYPINQISIFAEGVNSGGGGGGMGGAINDKGEVFAIITATGVKHVGQVLY